MILKYEKQHSPNLELHMACLVSQIIHVNETLRYDLHIHGCIHVCEIRMDVLSPQHMGLVSFLLIPSWEKVCRVDRGLPWLQAEVCFLRLPPGFPAVPQYLSHTFGCAPDPPRTGQADFPYIRLFG